MATTAGMRAYSYWVFGLQVTSELSLPELYAGAEPADVVIRRGPVPDDLPDAQAHGVLYQAAPGVFRLKVNGIARYLVTDGREIVVQADADADASAVRVFLLGSAMGALLLQRGILPLHTSAIESAGRCVAFAGNSGRGKSTLAAAFHGRGYRVLADDVLAVRDGRGVPPMAYSGSRELKLWADALDLLEIEADGLRRARPQVEKSCLPTGADAPPAPLPISHVYLLDPSNQDRLALEPVEGTGKLEVLVRHTYRGHYLEGLGGK